MVGARWRKKVAIPDALFKIVIREVGGTDKVETLAFIIPNILPKDERDPNKYLTSIARVEILTGLKFLTALPDSVQESVKGKVPNSVDW